HCIFWRKAVKLPLAIMVRRSRMGRAPFAHSRIYDRRAALQVPAQEIAPAWQASTDCADLARGWPCIRLRQWRMRLTRVPLLARDLRLTPAGRFTTSARWACALCAVRGCIRERAADADAPGAPSRAAP